jgi:hypothetical protein
VQQLADAEEIFVSEDVYSAEGVHALLTSRDVVSSVFKLKGVQQDLRVFRITKDLVTKDLVTKDLVTKDSAAS